MRMPPPLLALAARIPAEGGGATARIGFLEGKVAILVEKSKKASTGGTTSKPVVLATKPITSFMGNRARPEEEPQMSKKHK